MRRRVIDAPAHIRTAGAACALALCAGALSTAPAAQAAPAGAHGAIAVSAASSPAQPSPQQASTQTAAFEKMREEILTRTNKLRKDKKLPALKLNTRLNAVAQTWSHSQASKQKMAHNPRYSKQIPAGWRSAGENVAYGFVTAKAVVDAWRDSPSHYANMTRSGYTHVGIGIALDSDGRPYFTQTFGGYPDGLTGNLKIGDKAHTVYDPTITGKVKVGSTVTAKPGKWKPAEVKFRYQWYRDFNTKIPGATKAKYTPTAKDAGKYLSVRVTGRFAEDGVSMVRSSAAKHVAKAAFTRAPLPTITGTAKAGRTLTAKAKGFAPKPSKIRYQWYRNGAKISGATKSKYTLTGADKGKKVKVRVTASKGGYTTVTRSRTVAVRG